MAHPNTLGRIREQTASGDFSGAASVCLELLREEPGNIEANYLYGRLAIKMRRHEDAIVVFRKLLTIAPAHRDAHDNLAYLYHLKGDYTLAKQHAQAAIQIDPGCIESRLVLGAIAISEGENEQAMQQFEAARSFSSRHLHVEKAHLDALLAIGEFDAARDLSRKLIAAHPTDSYLYTILARSHRLVAGDPDVELVRSLLDSAGNLAVDQTDPDDIVRARMALFKLETDLGNTDVAFEHLRKAKEIRKSQFPLDLQGVVDSRLKMQSTFSPAFFAARTTIGCEANDPIFIVAMPRSGTTLLERIVSSHREVTAAGELPVVGRLMGQTCARFGANQYDLAALGQVPDEFWGQLGREYIRQARQRTPDGRYFTDKMPANYFSLGFIKAMLPRAKVIHLSRHPVATCLSIYEQDFQASSPFANDLGWLGSYYVEYRAAMDYWRGLFGESIIELEYESLVGDTSATIDRLGSQLGLDFDLDKIHASQQAGTILTASLWQARQPVHTASIARWKHLEEKLQPLLSALEPVWRRT